VVGVVEVGATGADQDLHVDVGRTVAALSAEEAQVVAAAVEGLAPSLLHEEAEVAVEGLAREASKYVSSQDVERISSRISYP